MKRLAALVLVVLLAGSAPALAAARSRPRAAAAPPKAAVVSPLLAVFGFGATVGLPEACGVARGAVANVASASGTARAVASALVALAVVCDEASTNGNAFVQAFEGRVGPFAAFNPVADAVIELVAKALVTFGTQDAKAIAPFGPTVVALAATLRFFEEP